MFTLDNFFFNVSNLLPNNEIIHTKNLQFLKRLSNGTKFLRFFFLFLDYDVIYWPQKFEESY